MSCCKSTTLVMMNWKTATSEQQQEQHVDHYCTSILYLQLNQNQNLSATHPQICKSATAMCTGTRNLKTTSQFISSKPEFLHHLFVHFLQSRVPVTRPHFNASKHQAAITTSAVIIIHSISISISVCRECVQNCKLLQINFPCVVLLCKQPLLLLLLSCSCSCSCSAVWVSFLPQFLSQLHCIFQPDRMLPFHSSLLPRWLLYCASPFGLTIHTMDADREPIFPVQQMLSLLFPPPPPRPLALDSSSSASSSFVPHHLSITSFPILVLTVLGILTTSVLLLTYYIFVIRCCLNWHSSSSSDTAAAGFISHRRRRAASSGLPAVTEPRGLEAAAIQSLPAFRYRKAIKKDTADNSECAVCISEFQEEERVRLLPSCLHVFHVDCIDTWLQSNANCPLCRAAIATNNSQLPLDQPLRPEEVVIQVITGAEEEEDTQAERQEANMAASNPAVDATTNQQVSNKKRKNKNAWHVSISKGDECIAVRKDRNVLPLRRSFSMDSLGGAGEVHLQIQNILQRSTHFHGDVSDSSSSTGTL